METGETSTRILGGIWNNKTVLINKISLRAVAQDIRAGSSFILWGCK